MKSSMRTAEPRDEELLRALLDGDGHGTPFVRGATDYEDVIKLA
jgi:hypothetical protein